MKSLEDLKKMREAALKKVEMREGGKDFRVVVGHTNPVQRLHIFTGPGGKIRTRNILRLNEAGSDDSPDYGARHISAADKTQFHNVTSCA